MVYTISSSGNIDGNSCYLIKQAGIYVKRHVRLDNEGLLGLCDDYLYVDRSNEIMPEENLTTVSCIYDGKKIEEFRVGNKVIELEPQKIA
jgi:hypothetical protein